MNTAVWSEDERDLQGDTKDMGKSKRKMEEHPDPEDSSAKNGTKSSEKPEKEEKRAS